MHPQNLIGGQTRRVRLVDIDLFRWSGEDINYVQPEEKLHVGILDFWGVG